MEEELQKLMEHATPLTAARRQSLNGRNPSRHFVSLPVRFENASIHSFGLGRDYDHFLIEEADCPFGLNAQNT